MNAEISSKMGSGMPGFEVKLAGDGAPSLRFRQEQHWFSLERRTARALAHRSERLKPRRPRLLRLSWVDLIEFDKKTKGQGIGEDERPAAKAKENRAAHKRCKPSRVI